MIRHRVNGRWVESPAPSSDEAIETAQSVAEVDPVALVDEGDAELDELDEAEAGIDAVDEDPDVFGHEDRG